MIAAIILLATRGIRAALVVVPLRPLAQWVVERLAAVIERPPPPHREIAVTLSTYPSAHSVVAAVLLVVLALPALLIRP